MSGGRRDTHGYKGGPIPEDTQDKLLRAAAAESSGGGGIGGLREGLWQPVLRLLATSRPGSSGEGRALRVGSCACVCARARVYVSVYACVCAGVYVLATGKPGLFGRGPRVTVGGARVCVRVCVRARARVCVL